MICFERLQKFLSVIDILAIIAVIQLIIFT